MTSESAPVRNDAFRADSGRWALSDMLRLDGAQALVTGAARGIGRAVVEHLLLAGASVAAVDKSPRPKGLDSDAIVWHRADVRDAGAAADIVAQTPTVSVLVNNAGSYPLVAWRDVGEDTWADAIDINLSSAARYSRLVAARLIAEGLPGSIVNISSVAAVRPVPMLVHYGVAKAGLLHLSRALAVEYGRAGIRVNTVLPGGIRTDGAVAAGVTAEAAEGDAFARPPRPLGDIGTTEDVARAALYFASAMSGYVTGAELVVDGGSLLR
jgi:NAD(P)-dependent dehydrogenase (short-subunit alcohol dehydrogenase family)